MELTVYLFSDNRTSQRVLRQPDSHAVYKARLIRTTTLAVLLVLPQSGMTKSAADLIIPPEKPLSVILTGPSADRAAAAAASGLTGPDSDSGFKRVSISRAAPRKTGFSSRVPDEDANDPRTDYPPTPDLGAESKALPPMARDDRASLLEDHAVVIEPLNNDFDLDGVLDPASLNLYAGPSHGTASVNTRTGSIRYTPDSNFEGTDAIAYKVSDNDGNESRLAVISISVTGVNDIPIANNETISTGEDVAVEHYDLVFNDSDLETPTDQLTVKIVTPPVHALEYSVDNGYLSYTPAPDYHGSDTLQYQLVDSDGQWSNIATVTITIDSVNDAPSALNDFIETAEDTEVSFDILANDVDRENDPIDPGSIVIVKNTRSGKTRLDPVSGRITYLPDPDFYGFDSFRYVVSDARQSEQTGAVAGRSNEAIVNIQVLPRNDPPETLPDSITIAEDTRYFPINVLENDSDADGRIDPKSIVITSAPQHGTAEINQTTTMILYSADKNYYGVDSFRYQVYDNLGLASEDTLVSIQVDATNDAPSVLSSTWETNEDQPIALHLYAHDVDREQLQVLLSRQPMHGRITGNPPHITYTPDADFHGTDSFEFTALDSTGHSEPASVTVKVIAQNDPPVLAGSTVTMNEDTPTRLFLNAHDIDSQRLVYQMTQPPRHGMVGGSLPDIFYVPDTDFHGADSLRVSVSDGKSVSEARIDIEVRAVNDTPVTESLHLTITEDTPIDFRLNGSDPDGDALRYTLNTTGLVGAISGEPPELTYTPAEHFHGTDEFSYIVSDDHASATGTVIFLITPVDDSPIAHDLTHETPEDTPVNIDLTAVDPDNDTMIYRVLSLPGHGELQGEPPDLIFTPSPDFHGSDSFIYEASDGTTSSQGTVNLAVFPVNDQPVAENLSAIATAGQATKFKLIGKDIDSNVLNYLLIDLPRFGSIDHRGDSVIYRPAKNAAGRDRLTFSVDDGEHVSNTAEVLIDVLPSDQSPLSQADSYVLNAGSSILADVLANDSDPEGGPLKLSRISTPTRGHVRIDRDRYLVYSSPDNFIGTESVVYIVHDEAGNQDFGTATFEVLARPSLQYIAQQPVEDGFLQIRERVETDTQPNTSPTARADIRTPEPGMHPVADIGQASSIRAKQKPE